MCRFVTALVTLRARCPSLEGAQHHSIQPQGDFSPCKSDMKGKEPSFDFNRSKKTQPSANFISEAGYY